LRRDGRHLFGAHLGERAGHDAIVSR
jgi:hypothetical protein